MAIRTICKYPDPVLRQKAKKIPLVDKSIRILVEDMIETMKDNCGCGLAAPQVGVSLRCIVIGMPEEEPYAIINPEFVKRVGEREIEEACLSVPELAGSVKRSESVIVKGLDKNGKPIRVKGRELLSQALEHEIDHLNGVLFIDRVESPEKLRKRKKMKEEEETTETSTSASPDK
ncbi:peptide deformylase [Dehalogenimonas alkenigignens]|uniref:Peptide deformylase n=1 Tax=Dehalogenimonas alkenigignens TaxID=1217799 RepID=A0A0W0GJ49_9CHLR|nr:peptide deformylase [Dehalogenimonas alkenigignens]KTB48558.1 peptide deformylase [Dehalogenimonas alkenigignens]